MYSKIIHISSSIVPENLGGVPRFANLLKRAIGCEVIKTSWVQYYITKKIINDDTLLIIDGAEASNIISKKNIVISCNHGCWAEFSKRNDTHRFDNEIRKQQEMWQKRANYIVSMSNTSAHYLQLHHGVKANKIILNGIDLNEFISKEIDITKQKPIVIHAAADKVNKGGDFIKELQSKCTDFDFQYLDAKNLKETSEKYRRGDLFLHLSKYEGDSIAIKEAASSGLPMLVTDVGIFEKDTKECPGIIIPWQESRNLELVIQKLHELWNMVKNKQLKMQPRAWAEKYADYERFAKEWREFLNEI